MGELRDLRAILRQRLETLRIDAFVYEADQGAHPDEPERMSLEEVAKTDVFVLIIGDSWGEITEREYDLARETKPCLVYERQGRRTDDPELERFVKKLSGARGVPSRRAFQTAVDLAEQVATDVQDWLVREYRRLSAAQADTTASARRRTEIDQNIARLTASTTQVLPRGTSADLLAWQLQEWFTALDYRIVQEPASEKHWTDMVILVPGRRGRHTRVLVRARDGEIQSPDVDLVSVALSSGGLDEVWLVSNRRISPAARKTAESTPSILLFTLDELIEEDVDFEPYFDWLDKQVQAVDIPRLYVPLAVTVREVDATGQARGDSRYEDVAEYVDRWLEDAAGEHLSLLGEFGTGKSWFALKYAHDLVRSYREAQRRGSIRPRIPLVIRLREYANGFTDVGALLTEFVFRQRKINIGSFAVLQTLDRMGRLLFIFDGFDEMAARVDQQKMVDNFWALAAVLGTASKAMLTCRTEYFQLASQAQDVFGGKLRGSAMRDVMEGIRFQVATLQMFDDARLRQVLLQRSTEPALVDAIMANQRLADLGRRPVMVDLLIEAMPELTIESADLSAVYYKAVSRKMTRDISARRTFTSMADKMFFMCEMSWQMLSTDQLKVHYKEISDRIRGYFGVASGSAEEDHWRHDLLSQTLLVRDDEGYYRRAHKSFLEFFAGYKLSAELGALKADYLGALGDRAGIHQGAEPRRQKWSEYFVTARPAGGYGAPLAAFELEEIDRLVEGWGSLLHNDATRELIASLCDRDTMLESIAALAPMGQTVSAVAARGLEVAAFQGGLQHADLSGLVFERCRLDGSDLRHANISGSVWNDAKFNRVSLDHAICTAAHFRGSVLSDVTLRGADLSACAFDQETRVEVHVRAAVWGVVGSDDVLVVVLGGMRFMAINPASAEVASLGKMPSKGVEPKELASWLIDLKPVVIRAIKLTALFPPRLSDAGWRLDYLWAREYRGDTVEAIFTAETFAHGDVERLSIRVTEPRSGKTLLNAQTLDTTLLPGGDRAATRALCLSVSGTLLGVVYGQLGAKERACIKSSSTPDVELSSFAGSVIKAEGETVDKRGAAFSRSEEILAICETPDTIGFWSTRTGALIGRAVFQPPAAGAKLDGATGLSDAFLAAAAESVDGCRFERASDGAMAG